MSSVFVVVVVVVVVEEVCVIRAAPTAQLAKLNVDIVLFPQTADMLHMNHIDISEVMQFRLHLYKLSFSSGRVGNCGW